MQSQRKGAGGTKFDYRQGLGEPKQRNTDKFECRTGREGSVQRYREANTQIGCCQGRPGYVKKQKVTGTPVGSRQGREGRRKSTEPARNFLDFEYWAPGKENAGEK